MKTKITTVSKLNSIEIQCVERNNEYYVPIRPICDILGIDFSSQKQRIERDDILNSVVVMTTTTGADKKQYEMFCLPVKYIFGWLFSIDANRVKEESKDAVISYKKECYDVLYNYFFGHYQDIDKQIKEAAMRKARIKELKDDLDKNPPQDSRIKELLELEIIQNKESRLPYSHIGKRLKAEYSQLILDFDSTEQL